MAFEVTRAPTREAAARASSPATWLDDSARSASAADTTIDATTPATTRPAAGSRTAVATMATTAAVTAAMIGTSTRTWASTTSSRSRTAEVRTSERLRRPSRAGVSGTRASYVRTRRSASEARAASWERTRSTYRSTGRAMPKVRTQTMATSNVRIAGKVLAWTMSQPEVAVSATPDVVASPPMSPERTRAGVDRSRTRLIGLPSPARGGR